MSKLYNVSAAFGMAAAYVHAIIAVLLALLCVSVGSGLVRTPDPKGTLVQAAVTHVTSGCKELGRPCTVTVSYSVDGTKYTSTFASELMTYTVGEVVSVRVAPDNPQIIEQELPRRALGWTMIVCAALTIALATGLVHFASDSKNFASAAGAFVFLKALL